MMWLNVSTTNNNPKVILLHYLLTTLESKGKFMMTIIIDNCCVDIQLMSHHLGFPSILRCDHGTENSILASCHMALVMHVYTYIQLLTVNLSTFPSIYSGIAPVLFTLTCYDMTWTSLEISGTVIESDQTAWLPAHQEYQTISTGYLPFTVCIDQLSFYVGRGRFYAIIEISVSPSDLL